MDDAAAGKRGLKGGQGRREFADAAGDLGLRSHVNVVLGKVDASFEQRDQFDESLLDGSDAAAERSAQLAGGLASLGERLRLDQIADGLSLGEVEAAGKKSALGEFARLGQPRAPVERAPEQQIQHYRRAMRRNLHHILGGVGVGRGKPGDEGFVDAAGLLAKA